jgi:hypothetical protein
MSVPVLTAMNCEQHNNLSQCLLLFVSFSSNAKPGILSLWGEIYTPKICEKIAMPWLCSIKLIRCKRARVSETFVSAFTFLFLMNGESR